MALGPESIITRYAPPTVTKVAGGFPVLKTAGEAAVDASPPVMIFGGAPMVSYVPGYTPVSCPAGCRPV